MKVARIAALVLLVALSAAAPASAAADGWALSAIRAPEAWALAGTGSPSVLVGAVDSGVNLAHPAFAGTALYTNAAEAGGRPGVDDDGNGCVDDVHGCDFANGDGDPTDDAGHGTATAGEVVAGAGSATPGVAPGSRLVVAKVLDANGAGTTGKLAAGLNYVADAGARVVVVSVGGVRSAAVHEAIASHPGTLFVVAAGNGGADVDAPGSTAAASYPCADPSDNVVCVGASTATDTVASISNTGATSVDLFAPGERVAAPTLTGSSNGWTGTSFAAPLVAGTAALAFAQDPGASVAQVKAAILSSVDRFGTLAGKAATGGRLDAYRALRALRGDDPGQQAAARDAAPAPAPAAAPVAAAPPATPAPAAAAPATGKPAAKKASTKKASARRKAAVKKASTKRKAAQKRKATAKRSKAASTKRTR